jgi:hypothetical protein
MAGRRSLRFALLLPLWIFLDATLVQAEGRFLAPGAGATLESGATVRVAWSVAQTRDREPDEMELMLSLDGGRTFLIRVTRDLPPETLVFAWRVPALPTAHAQLALRTGEGGAEEIALVSGEFAIVAGAATPLEPTAKIAGEWRTRDALDGVAGQRPLDPPALADDSGTVSSLPRLSPALAPKPPLAVNRGGNDSCCLEASIRPAAPAILPPLSRIPVSAPMRE